MTRTAIELPKQNLGGIIIVNFMMMLRLLKSTCSELLGIRQTACFMEAVRHD